MREGIGGYGVVGTLSRRVPGRTVLLRADMDALPVNEETELPHKSRNENVMHACRHDMHATSMLAIAALLQAVKAEWPGMLICMLQPDEEKSGRAQAIVDDGLYTRVFIHNVILGIKNQKPELFHH